MKIKNILLAAAACVASILPAEARIERKTSTMLETIAPYVLIEFNTDDCEEYNILGAYMTVGDGAGVGRKMVLCPGEYMNSEDHATARHEMVHVLQHCVNVQRGTPRNTPIVKDIDKLAEMVNEHVSEDDVVFIKSNYPREKWLIEFEAVLGENVFTASQLIELWNNFDCESVFA